MSRLGPRARQLLGVLVAVLAVVAGYLLTGPDEDTRSGAELVPGHAGGGPPMVTVTAAQQITVDDEGNVVVLTSPSPRPPRPQTPAGPSTTASPVTAGPRGVVPVPVPDTAWTTLAEIDAGRWPGSANAQGTKGGDTWRNREGTLPRTDGAGVKVGYREWDVNPKRRGQSRDAERIVTGSDATAWYTGDHYTSFVRMR